MFHLERKKKTIKLPETTFMPINGVAIHFVWFQLHNYWLFRAGEEKQVLLSSSDLLQ